MRKEGYGFSFEPSKCEECGGKCCYGEDGYIFVTYQELLKIADFLGLKVEILAQKYIKKVGYRFSIVEEKSLDSNIGLRCVFFDENTKKCGIYPVRPRQCVTFPFWNHYKTHPNELKGRCIGVKFDE